MTQGIRPWPIAMGALADLIGTTVFGLAYGVFTAARTPDSDVLELTTLDLGVTLVVGLLFMVVGGYVAGRLATARPVAHGVTLGVVMLLFGVLLEVAVPESDMPQWMNVLSWVAQVPAAAVGGWLASRRPQGA